MTRDELLRPADVEADYGVSVDTLKWWRRLERAGEPRRGPAWQYLGGRRIVYRRSDVDAWVEAERQRTETPG